MAGFESIVGHEQIIRHLKNAIAMDKVSHAYIFNGPDHSGKHLLAEAFAQTLQCESAWKYRHPEEMPEQISLFAGQAEDWKYKLPPDALERLKRGEPCQECHSCRQALGKNHPDIIYVSHEKPRTISVTDIREQVNGDIAIKPYSSRYKIYIVDEAEKMNVNAQNALLKTLEEPPAYAVILLLTTNADLFLQTIRSRCIRLDLRAVEDDKIRRYLMHTCTVPDYQADICVAFAQGNPGKARLLASAAGFHELKDMTVQLMRRMGRMEIHEIPAALKSLGEFKEQIDDFLDLLQLYVRDLLLCKSNDTGTRLTFKDQSFEIGRQAEQYSYQNLQHMLEAIETAGNRIRMNVSFDLTIELLLLTLRDACRSES